LPDDFSICGYEHSHKIDLFQDIGLYGCGGGESMYAGQAGSQKNQITSSGASFFMQNFFCLREISVLL
jgi:hypothetical protein